MDDKSQLKARHKKFDKIRFLAQVVADGVRGGGAGVAGGRSSVQQHEADRETGVAASTPGTKTTRGQSMGCGLALILLCDKRVSLDIFTL